jgi:hypothetical protein
LLTQKVFRRPIPFFYGAEQIPVLQFGLSIMSLDEITAEDYSQISSWLYGQMNYKELRICQPDMQTMWFNAFLTQPKTVRVGNIIRGTTCTVVCDAPWGYKPSVSYSYGDYTGDIVSQDIEIFNNTGNNFYTYPTNMIITANSLGGNVKITNITDSYRESNFIVYPNEQLVMNCDLQTISSSLSTYPLSQMGTSARSYSDKNWLRLLPNYNLLTITGNFINFSIMIPSAAKIGG